MDQQRAQEEKYLQKVYAVIMTELGRARNKRQDIREQTIRLQKDLWQEVGLNMKDEGKSAASAQYLNDLRINKAIYSNNDLVLLKMERMKMSAYFGRVDFKRDGRPLRPTYIGISTLFDPKDMTTLVCDWRAPVGTLFYEDRTGAVSYTGPDGIIEGELMAKRQYKVEEDRLIYFFDSTLTIDDEMLREALIRSSDAHMRTIVTTIQKNQNRIIRESVEKRLVVQGVAGSGKTAVALHRVAWLLYRYRDDGLSYGNLLLFTPNRAFVEYIREVLPELGEQNVAITTLTDSLRGQVPRSLRVQTPWAALEYALRFSRRAQTRHDQQLRSVMAGSDMAEFAAQYANKLAGERSFFDIRFEGELLAGAEELSGLYALREHMPARVRLLRVRRVVLERLAPLYRQRLDSLVNDFKGRGEDEKDALRMARRACQRIFARTTAQLRLMTDLNASEAYRRMWNEGTWVWVTGEPPHIQWNEICEKVLRELDDRYLSCESAALYAYLKIQLYGPPRSEIRHVLIDEAQDYSAVEMALIESLYPGAGMTVLKDASQRIQTHLSGDTRLPDAELIELKRCYRASLPLCDFTRHLLPDPDAVIPFEREGELPRLIPVEEDERAGRMAADIEAWRKAGPVAVIGRTDYECQRIYETLRDRVPGILWLRPDADAPAAAVTVLPSWLAKGLEFDTVLVWEAADYGRQERSLFYTVCTRALHRLHLYTARADYAPPVPETRYERDQG